MFIMHGLDVDIGIIYLYSTINHTGIIRPSQGPDSTMLSLDQNQYESLLQDLEQTLAEFPSGISEYNLLQELIKSGFSAFSKQLWSDNLSTFQAHFILFHLLYLLRDRRRMEQRGDLRIECLKIELLPWQMTVNPYPAELDHVREYYLRLTNLTETTQEDVEKLLAKFWHMFSRFENREDALAVLGLQDPVTQTDIKSRYRTLVRQHHPDHGGSVALFLEVKDAARKLLG